MNSYVSKARLGSAVQILARNAESKGGKYYEHGNEEKPHEQEMKRRGVVIALTWARQSEHDQYADDAEDDGCRYKNACRYFLHGLSIHPNTKKATSNVRRKWS